MELIENLLQLLTTFLGALLSGIAWQKSRRQAYFLLLCFYGCFALGSLYWTLYLLLFHTTPRVFYVSEFGWVASVIFLRILQVTLTDSGECGFRCRKAWLAPLVGVPLLGFYCTYGDILADFAGRKYNTLSQKFVFHVVLLIFCGAKMVPGLTKTPYAEI